MRPTSQIQSAQVFISSIACAITILCQNIWIVEYPLATFYPITEPLDFALKITYCNKWGKMDLLAFINEKKPGYRPLILPSSVPRQYVKLFGLWHTRCKHFIQYQYHHDLGLEIIYGNERAKMDLSAFINNRNLDAILRETIHMCVCPDILPTNPDGFCPFQVRWFCIALKINSDGIYVEDNVIHFLFGGMLFCNGWGFFHGEAVGSCNLSRIKISHHRVSFPFEQAWHPEYESVHLGFGRISLWTKDFSFC